MEGKHQSTSSVTRQGQRHHVTGTCVEMSKALVIVTPSRSCVPSSLHREPSRSLHQAGEHMHSLGTCGGRYISVLLLFGGGVGPVVGTMELAAAEEAGVPPRGAPQVPRPGRGVHVDAAQAEARPVAEQELEHVHERPHEVAPRVRPVPAPNVEFFSCFRFKTIRLRPMTWGKRGHAPYGRVEDFQVVLQELGPELVVDHDRARRVGGLSGAWNKRATTLSDTLDQAAVD